MLPNTALRLKEKKQNKLRDFLNVAGELKISHFLIFSTSSSGITYMRTIRSPQGPTLTYKVEKFCLIKDIHEFQARPHSLGNELQFAPLLVLNNFSIEQPHIKLCTTMWQNMFPTLNVQKLNLSECKRVVLLDYDKQTGLTEFRHYVITVVPHGVSKTVKAILNRKKSLPSLTNFADIADFINSDLGASESDTEYETDDEEVTIPSRHKKKEPIQMAVKLVEIGPRMQLKLMKIQEGFCAGDILYQDESDTSGSGADSSLKKKKVSEDEKEKELKRVEALAIKPKAEKIRGSRPAKPQKDKDTEKAEDTKDKKFDKFSKKPSNKTIGKKRQPGNPKKSSPAKRRKSNK